MSGLTSHRVTWEGIHSRWRRRGQQLVPGQKTKAAGVYHNLSTGTTVVRPEAQYEASTQSGESYLVNGIDERLDCKPCAEL